MAHNHRRVRCARTCTSTPSRRPRSCAPSLAVVARRRRHPPPRPPLGRHRRGLHGHGRAARRARPDHARLPDRGRVHRRGRRLGRARRAARRRRDPGHAALATARAAATCATSCYLQVGVVVAATLAFGALALLDPAAIPSIPVALRPLVWWIVGVNALDLRRARAARAAHVPAHAPRRRPGRRAPGLVVARDRRRDVPAQPGLVGRLLGRPRARARRVPRDRRRARERSRARDAVAGAALRDRRPQRRDRGGGAARRLGRAPARAARRSRTPRRASTRAASRSSPSRSARSSACAAGACAASRWPRCCTTSASCRCRRRSSRKAAPLSRAEFEVIKRHPADGAALLGHIGGFDGRAAARARPPRAPRRQRLPRRPARRRAVARGPHPRRLRRLRRAHERARLPPRLHAGAGAHDPRPAAAGPRSTPTCSTRSRASSARHPPCGSLRQRPEAPSELPGRRGARQQRRDRRRGSASPRSTLQTASVIGRSTPASRASAARAGAVCRPSTTIPTSPLRVLGRDAAREQLARGAVARVPRGARRDEVAETGEAGVGARIGSERRAEARHLGEAARDQRRSARCRRSRGRRRCRRRSRSRSWRRRTAARRARPPRRRRGSASSRARAGARTAISGSELATTLAAGWPAAISSAWLGPESGATRCGSWPVAATMTSQQQPVRRGIEALRERDHERARAAGASAAAVSA